MSSSRADILAMRRRLLVLDASFQRLKLQRDVSALAAAVNPAALLRTGWQRLAARPLPAVAALAALLLLRRAGLRRTSARALGLWRIWRDLRGLFSARD